MIHPLLAQATMELPVSDTMKTLASLIGVMVLTGFEHAQRMAKVPGVVIPDAVLQRFSATASPADQAKVGQEIAAEQICHIVREGWAGLYLMSTATSGGTLDILRAGLGK